MATTSKNGTLYTTDGTDRVNWYPVTLAGNVQTQGGSDVETALSGKQAALTFDDAPTASSNNPVKSGGIKTAIDAKYSKPSGGIPATDLASGVQGRLIPSGGTTGQVLKKSSGTDYAVEWDDESGGGGSGLTSDIKEALMQLAEKVAYIDNQGGTYYDDLYYALYPDAPRVASISAAYTQSGVVFTTDTLDSLKSDLVVTATYTDTTTETVPSANYTLSGTLTAGTSTITVTYSGKTTTFSVTVVTATNFLTDATKWNKGSAITLSNRTSDGFSAAITAKGWNAWTFEGGTGAELFVTTDTVQNKSVRISFDVTISNYNDGSGMNVGVASWSTNNPTTGNNRTGYEQQNFTTSGSYDFTIDLSETNLVYSASQYLGLYIYFNMNNGASAVVSNLKGVYY